MKVQRGSKLEAPDGGWGIFVCIGMAMPFISCLAALPSFGLVFGDFLKSIGAETSAIAFITSAFFCSYSFAGLFSGSLFIRFGLRFTGVLGGCLYFIGSIAQIFVTSVVGLLFAFSLLQGVAFGLIVPASYTTFNNYFVKKRVMWMSFAQSLIGMGTMFYPVAMQALIELYGFRGSLVILAAINSHAILGMLLMQPVEWHMRKVPLTDQELVEVNVNARPTTSVDNKSENARLLEPPVQHNLRSSMNTIHEESAHVSRRASIASLGNWTGSIVVSDATPQISRINSRRQSTMNAVQVQVNKKEEESIWQKLVDFLDLTLMKKPIYVNIVLGMSFALYSDIAFFTLQPMYLFELGFSKPNTATIIAIGAAADLASRIFLACTAIFVQIPSRYIYLAGSFFTIISRFGFLYVYDFTGMAFITALLGFLRTWVHVPLPLVIAEYLPKERFATGYGLFMFLQGNIMFAVGPIVGYLRDITQDYIITFHCLNLFMALCAIPWIIEIVCVKFRRKNKN